MWSRRLFYLLAFASLSTMADELRQSKGMELVKAHCVACHSLQLVSQHRMNRNGWLESIRYMQRYHNLWALGPHEEPILDYLVSNYGPDAGSQRRRANLPYIVQD